jgi:hypothetical protein
MSSRTVHRASPAAPPRRIASRRDGDLRALAEVQETFGLSQSELARLFDRTASSLIEWRSRGIPQDKKATLGRLRDLAKIFRRKIYEERIPEVVRTRDEWLGDRSILETLSSDPRNGIDAVYAYLDRLFSYIPE